MRFSTVGTLQARQSSARAPPRVEISPQSTYCIFSCMSCLLHILLQELMYSNCGEKFDRKKSRRKCHGWGLNLVCWFADFPPYPLCQMACLNDTTLKCSHIQQINHRQGNARTTLGLRWRISTHDNFF